MSKTTKTTEQGPSPHKNQETGLLSIIGSYPIETLCKLTYYARPKGTIHQ